MEYGHRRGNDPMDLDVLRHAAEVEEDWMTGQGEGAWEWSFNPWQADYQEVSELDYFNNNSTGGKSKGKGKSFKGYGKGSYNGGPKGQGVRNIRVDEREREGSKQRQMERKGENVHQLWPAGTHS